ncbi:stonin-1 [Thalassophryne amazonica]|uniref:stonin-1 n=1 Tax=Thalassophryne amazonica TaxID=390379 RepID=UPI0014723B6D|nr:stonin-1 [Thalassophryne amazonica]
MCSTNHSNWVTFEDDSIPLSSPHKTPQSSGSIKGSVPRPNGLKLVLPPIRNPSWSFNSSIVSSQSNSSLSRRSYTPCDPPFSTPVSGVPTTASPFHSSSWERNDFFQSCSSPSTTSVPSPGSEATHQTSDAPSPFPSFQGNSGHFNPLWDGSRNSADVDSSSSDSETDNSLPRFFIRTKDGSVPVQDQLQSSFSYLCHKLEGLQAEKNHEAEMEMDKKGKLSCKDDLRNEVLMGGSSQFAPRGLFRSQKRDGWSLMLRIPEKKNRMSSRQWGLIYLRLLAGGVLQMYYEKGLEKPFKEFQLLPQCRLSDLKVESYSEPRKVLTVKVEHFSYTEKKRYHPKLDITHEAEVEQLLKFGSTAHDDMEDLVVSLEEEIFKLYPSHQPRRQYEEQELSLQITDHIWIQLDKCGGVMERAAFTQIHCLTFLNGQKECFLALNDLGLLRSNSSYVSKEDRDVWMEISDCHFHKCVKEMEFCQSRLIKFSPPDACRVELIRYKTVILGCTEMPFSIKAVVTVQGAYVELQAFLNMSATFLSSMGTTNIYPLCENVVIRVPVPGDWVKVTQTVALLRQRSLKARMNRNACLGSISVAESQPVMQVSIGTVKYENVYSAIVWRIDRLPAKNTAVDHPQSFSCKLELGSDQEIPSDWYPFVTMECEIMGAVVSQTRVKSLGITNDIQPQKHITSWTRYHCQAKLYLSIIEDVIENMRELFLDEGLEDSILGHLKHLWESKVMQSKAMEDMRKNIINPCNFVLQLPANYNQSNQKVTDSLAIHENQTIQNRQSYPVKNNTETLPTFSLPAAFTYPVQIPAGVTLQTASGQLYKVNVPMVVTQAQQPFSSQTLSDWTESLESAAAPPNVYHDQDADPFSLPDTSVAKPPQLVAHAPPVQQSNLPQQLQIHVPNLGQLQGPQPVEAEVTMEESEPDPQPVDLSVTTPSCSQLLEFHISAEEALTPHSSDIEDILKEVMEERENPISVRNGTSPQTDNQSEPAAGLELQYRELSDIVQLDGTADKSDTEEGAALEENDFLCLINAEAIKALQEGESSDGDSTSSSSDGEGADKTVHVEDEDPLNSGDDVVEQDIPDLFDTDNVIVCQYDKIHRSKNRWKFHLKDGVMCYGGRDYVFSKAVGEAEW